MTMGTTTPPPFRVPGWDAEEGAEVTGTTSDPIWFPVGVEAEADKTDKAEAKTARRAGRRALLVCLMLALVIAGGFLLWWGLRPQVFDAPAPPADIHLGADAPVAGPGPDDAVDVNGALMTPQDMSPMHVFIPALGAYSPIVAIDRIEQTRYKGYLGMAIPTDPTKTGWWAKGAPVALNGPETEGTTFLTGHVSWGKKWGTFRYLYTLTGGELVWTTDEEGNLSTWKITELITLLHTEFPQEFWSAEGERRLVIATCAEYSPRFGFYTKNVFAIAIPVDPETGQPWVEEEELVEEEESVGEHSAELS